MDGLSAANLHQLVAAKKYKDYRPYIMGIEEQNQKAEGAVVSVLKEVLVTRKNLTPQLLLGAMVLYKQVLIGGVMEFVTSNDLFPVQIHKAVGKICEYKSQDPDCAGRGATYLSQSLKLPPSDELAKQGNSIVLLALELTKAMAKWYPNEYDETSTLSIFNKIHQQLLKQGVTFPDQKEFLMVKPQDEKNFKVNYERFLQAIDEDAGEIPEGESNIPQVNSKPVPKPEPKPQTKAQSKPIIRPQPKAEPKPQKPVVPPLQAVPKLKPSNSEPPSPAFNVISPRKQSGQQLQKQQSKPVVEVPQSLEEDGNTMNEPVPWSGEKETAGSHSNMVKKQKSMGLPQGLSPKKSNLPQLPQKLSSEMPDDSSYIGSLAAETVIKERGDIDDLNFPQKGGTAEKNSKFKPVPMVNRQSVPGPSSSSFSPVKPPNPTTPTKKDPYNLQQPEQDGFKKEKRPVFIKQDEPDLRFSFSQYGSVQQVTPKKMPRTEKPGSSNQSVQLSPKPPTPQKPRKKSLPKTQKRHNLTGDSFKLGGQTYDFSDKIVGGGDDKLGNTLSFWARERRKNNDSGQKQEWGMVVRAVDQMPREHITYLSVYFEPVLPQMRSLREQALNLQGSGKSCSLFYFGPQLQGRLVKESTDTYLLILHNTGLETLLLAPGPNEKFDYCKDIKIKNWGNRPQPAPYRLGSNRFIDIKFTFSTKDPNFRFLSFWLSVNGQTQSLVVPITLLDVAQRGHVNPQYLVKQKTSLKVMTSDPFILTTASLPDFLRGSGGRKIGVIGSCELKLGSQRISVLLKSIPDSPQLGQLQVIYGSKGEEEDLAKVILYLLTFLLSQS